MLSAQIDRLRTVSSLKLSNRTTKSYACLIQQHKRRSWHKYKLFHTICWKNYRQGNKEPARVSQKIRGTIISCAGATNFWFGHTKHPPAAKAQTASGDRWEKCGPASFGAKCCDKSSEEWGRVHNGRIGRFITPDKPGQERGKGKSGV